MKILQERNTEITRILGSQQAQDVDYRPICYMIESKRGGETVLYNTLTIEIISLNPAEYADYRRGKYREAHEWLYKYLIENWYLIPEGAEEYGLYRKLEQEAERLNGAPGIRGLTLATVFTTTACNARCPYCYEHGVRAQTMTHETAMDVGDYICRHALGRMHLKWFGGEPLLNTDAIQTICRKLYGAGITYQSTMTTNGALADRITEKEKSFWNLRSVQITLDGPDGVYQGVKRYVSNNGNWFEQVIRNIEHLNSLGVYVSIRMNLSGENRENLRELIGYLNKRLGGLSDISAYVNPLFEQCGNPPHSPTEEELNRIYADFLELETMLDDTPLVTRHYPPGYQYFRCMADNRHSLCFLPEGKLSVCEHHCEDEIIGTIYEDPGSYDGDILRRFAEKADRTEHCKGCFYYPLCFRLKLCETNPTCTEGLRKYYRYVLERQIDTASIPFHPAGAVPDDDVAPCHFYDPALL